jgi:hypothetical protein
MWLAIAAVGCSCFEEKKVVSLEPSVEVKPETPTPAPVRAPAVTASWQQVQLAPQRMELVARIDYGPAASPLTVQLELPLGLRINRGRAFFTLAPSNEPKSHVEPLSLSSDALPVNDLVMVVTGPGVTIRAPYRFGRSSSQ